MNKRKITMMLAALMLCSILPATAFAHHVGDKSIPGQDYQVEDGWLDPRAHMNSPWNTVETERVDHNKRELLLSVYNELSDELDMRNDNSTLHEIGERFDHSELWPAFTGRYPVTDNGQK